MNDDTISTQTNAMISYLYQIIYEQGELLRKHPTDKTTKLHAGNIAVLARTISNLRWQDYEVEVWGKPQPEPEEAQPEEPQGPPVEPAEWDQERTPEEQP